MQLVLIFLAASLLCGKSFAQIKPVLQQFGGEEAASALQRAEELSDMLSAVVSTQTVGNDFSGANAAEAQVEENGFVGERVAPLCPIAPIADERILSALSRFVATGE